MERGLRQPPSPRSARAHYSLCCRPPPSCYCLCCRSARLCCTQTKSSNPASSVCQRLSPATLGQWRWPSVAPAVSQSQSHSIIATRIMLITIIFSLNVMWVKRKLKKKGQNLIHSHQFC